MTLDLLKNSVHGTKKGGVYELCNYHQNTARKFAEDV